MHAAEGAKLGQNGLSMGWFHFFVHPKQSKMIFEKTVVLTHFGPIFGPQTAHFPGIFHGPKRVITGSKWAKNNCLSVFEWSQISFGKMFFCPILTHFWSRQNKLKMG